MWKTSNRVNPRGHSKQRAHTETGLSESTNVVRGHSKQPAHTVTGLSGQHQRCEDTEINVHIQRLVYLAEPTWNK